MSGGAAFRGGALFEAVNDDVLAGRKFEDGIDKRAGLILPAKRIVAVGDHAVVKGGEKGVVRPRGH